MKRREDTKIKKMKAEKRRAKVSQDKHSIKNDLSVFSSAQSLPNLFLFLLSFVGSA